MNTSVEKVNRPAAIMAGGPGAASKSPDGLEQAIGGSNDKVVQAALVPAGGESMGKYKKLETLVAPAINQGLALKTEKKLNRI